MSSVQDHKARLTEAQKKQHSTRKNARAQANDTNRVNQGLQPRSASFREPLQGTEPFAQTSDLDQIHDPGTPDPRMFDEDKFNEQEDAHLAALSAKDTAENKTFDDWGNRLEGRREAKDFTLREAEMIRERSGHTRLGTQKAGDLAREDRATPFPDRGGERDGT